VNHLILADAGPYRAEVLEFRVERDQAEHVLEEYRRHADGADRPGNRGGNRHAVDTAAGGQRPVRHRDHRRRAPLFVVADNHRAEVRQRRLRPVDLRHAIAGLPVAQPDVVEAGSVEHAPVLADGELPHPPHDEELDLGQLGQVDEWFDVGLSGSHMPRGSAFRVPGSFCVRRSAFDVLRSTFCVRRSAF
jgi:hypothetical protein